METNHLPVKSKKMLYATLVFITLALVGAGAYALYLRNITVKNPLYSASQSATFSLYNPTYLPEGYTLDAESLSATKDVVLVTARNESGKTIIITQQPTPAEFDFDSFYDTRYAGAQDASSIYGRGKVGVLDGAMSGSLVTDSTWILVKGPEDLPAKDMGMVVGGLKPVR